jgi:hypothetical protein
MKQVFMTIINTEEKKHSVVRKYKNFKIRFYPSATNVAINSDSKTCRDLSDTGFQKLANYIFGSNILLIVK